MAIPSHYGTPTTASAQNATSLTIGSHVIGAGNGNIMLHVGIGIRAPAAGNSVTGVDWNSPTEALTQKKTERNANSYLTEGWTLVAPTETTADVVISFGPTNAGRINAGASNYQDVHQTTPVEVTAGSQGTGTLASTGIATLSVNSLLVDTAGHRVKEAMTEGTGQTERWEQQHTGGAGENTAASSDEGAATVQAYTQTYSWATSADFCHVVLALKEAGGTPVSQTTESDYEALGVLSLSKQKDFESLVGVRREL